MLAALTETYWTCQEIAARFKVNEDTVRYWIVTGKLRGLKLNRQWRVPEAAVGEFLAACNPGKELTTTAPPDKENEAAKKRVEEYLYGKKGRKKP